MCGWPTWERMPRLRQSPGTWAATRGFDLPKGNLLPRSSAGAAIGRGNRRSDPRPPTGHLDRLRSSAASSRGALAGVPGLLVVKSKPVAPPVPRSGPRVVFLLRSESSDSRAARAGRGLSLCVLPVSRSAIRPAVLVRGVAVRLPRCGSIPRHGSRGQLGGRDRTADPVFRAEPRSAWLHPAPGSAQFTDRPFDDYRSFDLRVGPAELCAAVAAMRKRIPQMASVSEDPREFELVHFNVNPEVYAPEGSRGRLGLAVRDIRVLLLGR